MTKGEGNVTIKDIAQICGVSRGTVDRVLNGRGKVKREVELLVLDTIKNMGYTKNRAGRALRAINSKPLIGVIVSGGSNTFFDDVIAGVNKAHRELSDYGVQAEIINMRGYDVDRQLEAIESLLPRISALVIQAINDPRISQRINELKKSGIPTVTVNTDLENSDRICYVGSNYYTGGETAAGLLRMVTGSRATLGIITGVSTLLGHIQRLQGFEERLAQLCPDIVTVARTSAMDDDEHSYKATLAMLKEYPQIDCLQIIAAGTYGACKAVIHLKRDKKILVSAFDNVPTTEDMIKRGIVKAVVCQQPLEQGYLAFNAAFDAIISGSLEQREDIIVENQIKILENLKP